jgi:hypothetical protein
VIWAFEDFEFAGKGPEERVSLQIRMAIPRFSKA